MKPIKLITIFFILLFIASACATGPIKTSEKYDLSDQFEQVSEILKYTLMSWDAIDNQSFILQTAPSMYYLIVLVRPSDQLVFSENIGISNTGNVVKPGFDKVTVFGPPYTDTFVIDKIFKLGDLDQVKAVRERLEGK